MIIDGNTLTTVTPQDICHGFFAVPDGVTHIGDCAFAKRNTLRRVRIPDSVTEIGNFAFIDCESLTEVRIPEGVTEIGAFAFAGCKALTEARIPEGIKSIESNAFTWCKVLTAVRIPEGVTKIGDYAFAWCEALKEVRIPEGVTEIGDFAFAWCEALKEVRIPDSVTKINKSAFDNCPALTRITWADRLYETEYVDGSCMQILLRKRLGDIEILYARYFPDGKACRVAKRGALAARGKTIKDAVRDLLFKEQKGRDVSEHVTRVKAAGKAAPTDYRLITGACHEGTGKFLEENGLTWEDAIPIKDACRLVEGQWGAETFLSHFQ